MEDARVAAARQVEAVASVGVVRGLLEAYDERLAVNVGLINENAALKRRLEVAPEQRTDGESLVPGLEKAYELINDALTQGRA